MEQNFDRNNPIYMMVHSGARGNTWCRCARSPPCEVWWSATRGEIIARPIKSNFREEGLSVLEYFISTHGGRKSGGHGAAYRGLGLPDPSARRHRPGRHRIREEDCGTGAA